MLAAHARCDQCEAFLPLEFDTEVDFDEQVVTAGWLTLRDKTDQLEFCSVVCLDRWAEARKPKPRKRRSPKREQ